jgi:biotin carboxylase
MPVISLVVGGCGVYGAGFLTGRYCERLFKKTSEKYGKPFHTPGAARTGRDDAIVVVDPFSTGARLAYEATKRGFKVVRVFSSAVNEEFLESVMPDMCKGLLFEADINYDEKNPQLAIEEIKKLPFHISSVIIGCETGVEAFDAITEAMPGIPSNGSATSAPRRDKWLMGEKVRQAGVRAVKQQECTMWEGEAEPYVKALGVTNSESGGWCVLKPTRSAATDGVYICKTLDEARTNWSKIFGVQNIFGDQNQTVLVQEFMKGKEYVVDSVSVEGEHKCVAIWEYDKRPCNGHQFVYFGMRLYQSQDGKKEEAMVKYMHSVLDALDVKHGPSHGELIWLDSEDAPCLVEVGCRPHGGEGTFIEMTEPIGYNKVSVMLDIVEKPYKFKRLPRRPERFKGGSMEVCLVSRQQGTLAAYPMLEQVKNLRSFKSLEVKVPVGGKLEKTINFVTTPGSVMLVHADGRVVEEDQAQIHRWEEEGKFYQLAGGEGSGVLFRSL